MTADSTKTVFDDAVEIFIDPTPDAADHVDYQVIVNSAGKHGYNITTSGNPKEDVAWDGKWEQAQSQHDGVWDFECAIPISSMSLVAKDRKTTDGVWLINLCRDWKKSVGMVGGGRRLREFRRARCVFVAAGTPRRPSRARAPVPHPPCS